MPTENRSSNTGVPGDQLPPCADDVFKSGVSVCLVGDVPKHAAERICQSLSAVTGWKIDWHYIGGRTHIKALAPAEQHHGEPVALPGRKSEPTEDSDVFTDAENSGFNACLDEIVKLGPLYTRADPGEVERLRTEIDQLRDARDQISTNYNQLSYAAEKRMEELDTLRAQLADLKRRHDGLHRDMATIAGREVPKGCTVADYAAAAIADALSASAEPSAPSSCTWTYNDDSFAWDTTCSESFLLMDDGPKENCMKFCCYCSKPIIQAPHKAES
ncbi:hypothetical protein LOY46_14360 [Pseudomonas sichuanensis]|uniref:hypothetical protein n=1 Tax=Pseudomonas sichuanensis TaxID=2213015 RepID=UPI00215E546E|nr:hypothetical protein [Pseudomonas sichuanensis]UVK80772.1 hypothetical protein LOY46_14360 [Pseudomonas sichuanensis]